MPGVLETIFGFLGGAKNAWSLWDKFKKQKPTKVAAGLTIEYRQEPPYVITEPAGSSGHAVRFQRVKVKNVTNTSFDDCIVKLVEMRRADGVAFSNAFLPVALITQHQRLQRRTGGRFKLSAGEEKLVEVAFLDETKPDSEIGLLYETNQYPNAVPRTDYVLKLLAHGGSQPVEAFFRLYVNEDGYLRLKKYENET